MVVTSANNVEGYQITAHLGVVRGIVVRSNNIISGFIGGLKTIFGGNISQFERVCDDARQMAYDRMVQHAQQTGANAIIAMRFDATEFSPGVTEVLAYGTAVKLNLQ
jgi:uncharacterized protein YbjQ (UPF0145 family)